MRGLLGSVTKTSLRIAILSALVAATVASTLLLSNAFAANHTSVEATNQTTSDVTSALLSQYGISATPITSSFSPTASPAEAVITAQRYVPAINSSASSAMLVQFTDPNYGPADASGSVTPLVANQPVWLVIQPNVVFPVSGPPGYTGPSTYSATAVAAVDATTGKFIEAMSVG